MLRADCLWFGVATGGRLICAVSRRKTGISGLRVCPEPSYAAEGPEAILPCWAPPVAHQGLHAACWGRKQAAEWKSAGRRGYIGFVFCLGQTQSHMQRTTCSLSQTHQDAMDGLATVHAWSAVGAIQGWVTTASQALRVDTSAQGDLGQLSGGMLSHRGA